MRPTSDLDLLPAAMRRLLAQADAAARASDLARADELYSTLASDSDSPHVWLTCAEHFAARGRYRRGLELALAAQTRWTSQGRLEEAASASDLLARVSRRVGDFAQARAFQRQALAWGATFEASVLLELAIDAVGRQENLVGAELATEALRTAEEDGDESLMARALGVLANLELLEEGEPEAALDFIRESLRLHRRLNDAPGCVAGWLTAAAAFAALGRDDSEARALARAQRWLRLPAGGYEVATFGAHVEARRQRRKTSSLASTN